MPDNTNNFMTAFVSLQVEMGEVKKQMEEFKQTVKKTAKDTEDEVKKSTKSTTEAFETMYRRLRNSIYAAGIGYAFSAIAKEAMKGQDAIFLLGAVLKTSGSYTKAAMEDFVEFADVLQDITTHSNDQILMTMRLQHSLGVSADKMKLATTWAIGLADALGLDFEASSRYVALALEGEFRMLSRYIPLLKTAGTEHEKLAILNKFATAAFELSGAKANTASGAYQQMKNTLQDLVQTIGYPLLSIITETAKEIKEWAKDNTGNIAYWAKMFFAHVGFVKDVIVDIVSFMKKDFAGGMGVGFKIVLELAVSFADSFVIVCGNMATRAYRLFVQEFGEKLGAYMIALGSPEGVLGKLASLTPVGAVRNLALMKGGAALIEGSRVTGEMKELGPQLELIAVDTANRVQNIIDQSGIDITDSTQKLRDRVVNIREDQHKALIGIELATVTETKKLMESLADTNYQPKRTREAREAEQSMKERITNLKAELDVQQQIGGAWYKTTEAIELQALALKAAAGDAKLYAELMVKVTEVTKQQEMVNKWKEFGKSVQSSMESAFEGIMRRGEDFKTSMMSIVESIIAEWMKMEVIKPAAQMFSSWLTKGVELLTPAGVAHGGGDVGSLPTRMVPAHVFAGAQKYHGLGPNEQAIIAEKGETISRGKAQPTVNLTLNLNAIDAQSGVAFLANNQQVLTSLFNKAIRQNDKSIRG